MLMRPSGAVTVPRARAPRSTRLARGRRPDVLQWCTCTVAPRPPSHDSQRRRSTKSDGVFITRSVAASPSADASTNQFSHTP